MTLDLLMVVFDYRSLFRLGHDTLTLNKWHIKSFVIRLAHIAGLYEVSFLLSKKDEARRRCR